MKQTLSCCQGILLSSKESLMMIVVTSVMGRYFCDVPPLQVLTFPHILELLRSFNENYCHWGEVEERDWEHTSGPSSTRPRTKKTKMRCFKKSFARKKDKAVVTRAHSLDSLFGKSEHFEYIPKLWFQEQLVFVHNVHVLLFVRYTSATLERIIGEMAKREGLE